MAPVNAPDRTGAIAAPAPPGRRSRAPYLLVAPTVLVLAAVFVVAMLTLAEFSLHRFAGGVSSANRTLAEWGAFLSDGFEWRLVRNSIWLGVITTCCCAVLGYATALALHRLRTPWVRAVCYFVLFSPLLTSVVARSYGWTLVLGDNGFVNSLAQALTGRTWNLLYNTGGVVIALTHILLPFMVFPLLSSLRQIDDDLTAAAADLGASPATRFRRITLPLSLPGLVAGAQLCFALTISSFATPSLLGGGRVQVLATAMYDDVQNLNWARAAVAAYVLLALALLAFAGFAVVQRRLVPARRER
jgi:putative spermidine/putrescine transport system permease protein